MLSCFTCTGMMLAEPKRFYSKKGDEISDFWLRIKRSENSNNYDILKFEAFKGVAKYINEEIHTGDMVSVRSRPISVEFKEKDGKKRHGVIFRVAMLELICHRNRLLLNEFGASTVPELDEREFQYWG